MLTTKNGKSLFPIGIGTWTISKENAKNEVDALMYYFENGANFIDVVLAYDNGRTLQVLADFIKQINREDIFINAFITFGCSNVEDIETQINTYLEKLNINFLDCVTLHGYDCIDFDFKLYVQEIERLKNTNKFLNIGYSNLCPSDFENLKNNMQYFEGLYNLECKINEDNKILQNCENDDIQFFAYQPLRRNRTAKQKYPELVKLANKYNKTQNQIIINWLIKHKNIGVLIKSSNKEHIKENIDSLNFEMEYDDYTLLDKFRNIDFDNLEVSYKNEPNKIRIDQIPNQPIGIL